jgi:hypothetical protein
MRRPEVWQLWEAKGMRCGDGWILGWLRYWKQQSQEGKPKERAKIFVE